MKKVILLAAIAAFGTVSTFAQSQQQTNSVAPVRNLTANAVATRQTAPVQSQAATVQNSNENKSSEKKDVKSSARTKDAKSTAPANKSASPAK